MTVGSFFTAVDNQISLRSTLQNLAVISVMIDENGQHALVLCRLAVIFSLEGAQT